jgi:hypothetical protein
VVFNRDIQALTPQLGLRTPSTQVLAVSGASLQRGFISIGGRAVFVYRLTPWSAVNAFIGVVIVVLPSSASTMPPAMATSWTKVTHKQLQLFLMA